MQELRIQAESAAALCLANESSFGWRSQAVPSTQTPERKRGMFQATEPTPRIPGHLSFLANSLRPQAATERQTPEIERRIVPPVSTRVPSAHSPTLERERITYPVLAPTPKLPGHLSHAIDHKSFKHDHESPISSTSPTPFPQRRLPPPASPPLYSQQPPDHKEESNIENKSDADYQGRKEEIISIIQAIVSSPLPNTRLLVIADMILQSQTASEIEGIISALDQNFPVVSVLGRLRRIIDFQEYVMHYNSRAEFLQHDFYSSEKTLAQHANCADRDQSCLVQEQESSPNVSQYKAKMSAVRSPPVVEAENYADGSYPASQHLRYGFHLSKWLVVEVNSVSFHKDMAIQRDDSSSDGGLSYVEEYSGESSVQDRREIPGPVSGRDDTGQAGSSSNKSM